MSQMDRRKQILGLGLLVLLVAGISCALVVLFTHLCCSSTSGIHHLTNFLDCSLLRSTLALEEGLSVLFGLVPLFFLLLTLLIPHLSEFIHSLYKPPRLASYLS